MPNAWVVATFAGVFLASVVLTVRVLISFCQNLERPIGSDPTDLPVLSYVMAAAEISLKQIRQQSDKMRDARTNSLPAPVSFTALRNQRRRGDGISR